MKLKRLSLAMAGSTVVGSSVMEQCSALSMHNSSVPLQHMRQLAPHEIKQSEKACHSLLAHCGPGIPEDGPKMRKAKAVTL